MRTLLAALRPPPPPAVEKAIFIAGDTLDYEAGRQAEAALRHHFRWLRRSRVVMNTLILSLLVVDWVLLSAHSLPLSFLFLAGAWLVLDNVIAWYWHADRAQQGLKRWAMIEAERRRG
jgi:hypothetical protein